MSRKQRFTIELTERPDGMFVWTLYGGTGKKVTDWLKHNRDELPFSSSETAVVNAAKAADKLLWLERSCT